MDEDKIDFSFKKLFLPLTNSKAFWIILVLGFIIFSKSLFNGFVGDDHSQIIENPAVHSIKNIPPFFSGGTFYDGVGQKLSGIYFKPLLSTFFSIIHSVFGLSPFGFHLFQVAIHILNSFILFLLFKNFFSRRVSILLALVFLVHPINSESVLYISATQEVLFLFFGLAALLLQASVKTRIFLLAPLLIFSSMLSKETGVLFLAISILYAAIFKAKTIFQIGVLSLFSVLIFAALRINAVGFLTKADNAPIGKLTFEERLLNIPEIFLFYIKTFFYPKDLSVSHQWTNKLVTVNNFYLPLILDILFLSTLFLLALVVHKLKGKKYSKKYIFFLLWFLIGISFHLQLFPLDATVAERWFYFTIIGLLGMIGVTFEAFFSNSKVKFGYILFFLAILILSTRTFIRTLDWETQKRLFTHDLKVSQGDYSLENGLSYELIKEGNFIEAKKYAENSISSYPFTSNYNNLGSIYINLGEFEKAKEAYTKALSFGDEYNLYESLGGLTLVNGDFKESVKFLNNAIEKYPQSAKLWYYLAVANYKLNNLSEAKDAIDRAYNFYNGPEISFLYYKIFKNEPISIRVVEGRLEVTN